MSIIDAEENFFFSQTQRERRRVREKEEEKDCGNRFVPKITCIIKSMTTTHNTVGMTGFYRLHSGKFDRDTH